MKQIQRYNLDLSKTGDSGEFTCPRCGTLISPDDDTEEAFSILEAKVNSQDLKELVIHCDTCGIHIHLTGFPLLQKLSETDEVKLASKKTRNLIVHFACMKAR